MLNFFVIFSCFLRFTICHCNDYEVTPMTVEQFPQPYYVHYDAPTNSLLFTDRVTQQIYRYDFHEKETYRATIENNLVATAIIPVIGEKHKYMICYNFTVAIIKWNGKDRIAKFDHDEFTVQPTLSDPPTVWDYAKISPNSQFYGGSLRLYFCSKSPSTQNAAFFHYDKSIYDNLSVCGAFDWDVKNKFLYLCNTCEGIVLQFKWDPKTGKIDDGRIVYRLENAGNDLVRPHGLTVDREGFVYIAYYSGDRVVKVDPRTKKKVKEFILPVKGISLITFGGPNWDILFVATQRIPHELTTGKLYLDNSLASGTIFMLRVKAKGYPSRNYRSISRNC